MFGSDTVVISSFLLSEYISCFLSSKPMLYTISRSQDLSPSAIYLKIRASVEELKRFKVSKQTQIFVTAGPREPFRSSVVSAFCAVRPKWVKPNSAHNESAVNVSPWSGERREWETAAPVLSFDNDRALCHNPGRPSLCLVLGLCLFPQLCVFRLSLVSTDSRLPWCTR